MIDRKHLFTGWFRWYFPNQWETCPLIPCPIPSQNRYHFSYETMQPSMPMLMFGCDRTQGWFKIRFKDRGLFKFNKFDVIISMKIKQTCSWESGYWSCFFIIQKSAVEITDVYWRLRRETEDQGATHSWDQWSEYYLNWHVNTLQINNLIRRTER